MPSIRIAFTLSARFATGRWRVTQAAGAGLAGLAGLAVLLFVAGDVLVRRLLTTGVDFIDRTAIWKLHWNVFLDSPLFGEGLGSFESVAKARLTEGDFSRLWNIRAAHSVYLQFEILFGAHGAHKF